MKARTFAVVLGGLVLLAAGAVGAWATTSQRTTAHAVPGPPLTAARFVLTADGVELATFSELVGLESGIEPAEYLSSSASGGGTIVKTLPGNHKPPSVTLKHGMTNDLTMFTWHQAVLNGALSARRSVSLVMFSPEGKAIARYFLQNAWPSKVEISGLKAGSAEALTETVTIVTERIQRVAP